jgi:hypothetical protein
MISKVYTPDDPILSRQIDEIIAQQFGKNKTATVVFTTANTTIKVPIGFLADRFMVIDKNADIRAWRTTSDSSNMYLQASGAGTVTIMAWKE